MSLFKPGLVVDYGLTSSYERLRQELLTQFPDRLDQPLAHWALTTDRHLPLALISRSLRELLSRTLNELYSTPGIGPKKISALILLLTRATQTLPGEAVAGQDAAAEVEQPKRATADASVVSEAVWAQWRATARQLGLAQESLGRFALTLRGLPRSLWATPLGTYLDLSLAEIRRLKTHGHKRVAAVLDVFACLHDVGGRLDERPHLAVRFWPRRLAKLDDSVDRWIQRPSLATHEAMQDGFALLLDQIQDDLGSQPREVVATLLRQRSRNLQEMARRLGLNRGSIYEVFANVGAMLGVRWPEGQVRLAVLTELLAPSPGTEREIRLLKAVISLYFPETDTAE